MSIGRCQRELRHIRGSEKNDSVRPSDARHFSGIAQCVDGCPISCLQLHQRLKTSGSGRVVCPGRVRPAPNCELAPTPATVFDAYGPITLLLDLRHYWNAGDRTCIKKPWEKVGRDAIIMLNISNRSARVLLMREVAIQIRPVGCEVHFSGFEMDWIEWTVASPPVEICLSHLFGTFASE
jgi:hypothetical protein